MSGQSYQTKENDDNSVQQNNTTQIQSPQRSAGNSERQDALNEEQSENTIGCSCSNNDITWRSSGNLRGSPPVRDEASVPNKCVVEDEAVYRQRRSLAEQMLQNQRQRVARGGPLMDSNGNVTDYRYWFAKVYSYVTENELNFAQGNTFYYPSYVMASVAYFEQIYADNFQAFSNNGNVEEHWREAFERCAANQSRSESLRDLMLNSNDWASMAGTGQGGTAIAYLIDLVHGAVDSLVACMQAHIRYDLPRAEAWVFNTYYAGMGCVNISDFRTDFMSMAGVFDNAGRQMNAHMAEVIGLPVDMMPKILQDTAMAHWFDADMNTERADTWQRAEDLVQEGRGGSGPYMIAGGQLSGNVTEGDHLTPINQLNNTSLRPSMESSSEMFDDNDSRSTIAQMTDAQIEAMPLVEKMRRIRGMISGSTLNEDEETILRILRCTSNNASFVVLVNGADAWDLLTDINFSQHVELRQLLRTRYYPHIDQNMAMRLLQIAIDGLTDGTAEELIKDILECRRNVDGVQLLVRLGEVYESGATRSENYTHGRDAVLWELTGSDDAYIRNNYPSTYPG